MGSTTVAKGTGYAMKRLFLSLLLVLSACESREKHPHPNYAIASQTVQATVIEVEDGDTYRVNVQGLILSIRSACIDAPEIGHSLSSIYSKSPLLQDQFLWGNLAKARVQQLADSGSVVQLVPHGLDVVYGQRNIAEVLLGDGSELEAHLVEEGLAPVYDTFKNTCPNYDDLKAKEATAKAAGSGVWGDSQFVMPWTFRKQHGNS